MNIDYSFSIDDNFMIKDYSFIIDHSFMIMDYSFMIINHSFYDDETKEISLTS